MASFSQQTNSDLVALGHADADRFDIILERLLDSGEANSEIAAAVERALDNGRYVRSKHVATLLARKFSPALYAKARVSLSTDALAQVTLYRAKVPDPHIEIRLCRMLYEAAGDDANLLRREIAEAIRDIGSYEVLPTLEAILFDQAPTLAVKRVIADAIDATGVFTLEALLELSLERSRFAFLLLISDAIAAVKARDLPPVSRNTVEGERQPEDGCLSNAHFEQQRAERCVDSDPVAAIMHLRRGAESLGKDLYRLLGHESSGKSAGKMMLGELMKYVTPSDVPEVFKHCLCTLQLFGNFASHDQGDEFKHLNRELALALISLYNQSLLIYAQWATAKARSQPF